MNISESLQPSCQPCIYLWTCIPSSGQQGATPLWLHASIVRKWPNFWPQGSVSWWVYGLSRSMKGVAALCLHVENSVTSVCRQLFVMHTHCHTPGPGTCCLLFEPFAARCQCFHPVSVELCVCRHTDCSNAADLWGCSAWFGSYWTTI